MAQKAVPMIHVPDVRATVDWYRDLGFTVVDTYGGGGQDLSFAIVSFGSSEVMFSEGGRPSTRHRREVDLYVYTDRVDDLYERLKERVDVVEGPHDSFYGMREFIIRDLNRFWITFGETSLFEVLMTAVREGNCKSVRAALDRGGLKAEALAAALAAASAGAPKNDEIAEMLKQAGAVLPLEVGAEILSMYAGKYGGKKGAEVRITVEDGRLFATPAGQQTLSLLAVDPITFRPVAFDGVTVTFDVVEGAATGFTFGQGPETLHFTRVQETESH